MRSCATRVRLGLVPCQSVWLFPISKVPADSRFFRMSFSENSRYCTCTFKLKLSFFYTWTLSPRNTVQEMYFVSGLKLYYLKKGFCFFLKKSKNGLHNFSFSKIKYTNWMEMPGLSFFLRNSQISSLRYRPTHCQAQAWWRLRAAPSLASFRIVKTPRGKIPKYFWGFSSVPKNLGDIQNFWGRSETFCKSAHRFLFLLSR